MGVVTSGDWPMCSGLESLRPVRYPSTDPVHHGVLVTKAITSLTDLLAISQDVLKAYKHQPWWRGPAVEWWALVPHVHRYHDKKGPQCERSIASKLVKLRPTRRSQ